MTGELDKGRIAKGARVLLVSTALAGVLSSAAPAMAQVEDIVVTARKREESVLEVPATTAVLSAETLNQYAVEDLKGVAEKVPGLQIGESTGNGGSQVTMRGIGTSTINTTIDQSVSLNVDGLQLTHGIAFRSAFFDMARVEVLKGPQALFFGKASPGGVIAVRTADPTDEFEVILRSGYEFQSKQKMAEAIVSAPITSTLKLRLAGQYEDEEGWFRNKAQLGNHPVFGGLGGRNPTHRRTPKAEDILFRGTVLWEPTESFTARLKVNYVNQDLYGSATRNAQLTSCPDGTGGLIVPFIGGDDCRINRDFRILDVDPAAFSAPVPRNGVPFSKSKQLYGSLELTYETGSGLTLTSVTGLYKLKNQSMTPGPQPGQFGTPFVAVGHLDRDDFTQEFRVDSDLNGPINFMMGGFYSDGQQILTADLPLNNTFRLLSPAFGQFAYLGLQEHDIDAESFALFGQVRWDLMPDLEVAAGARFTQETRSHKARNLARGLQNPTIGPVTFARPKITSQNISPELTVTYTPTDALTLFASAKRAFKSGSFNPSGIFRGGENTSFEDERVTGVEGGIKSRLLDRTLAVNASAYYYKFDDLQVGANDFNPATGQIFPRTINAAGAKIYGVDLDVTYTPAQVEGLTIYGAVNWNRARYTDFSNSLCWGGQTIAEGCNLLFDPAANRGLGGFTSQDLSGEPLVSAPEWTANAGFNYERPLTSGTVFSLGANARYTSKYLTNTLGREDMYQDGHTKIGATVAVRDANDAWELALIGNNLTNKLVMDRCSNSGFADAQFFSAIFTGRATRGPSGVEELSCQIAPPREVWLRLTLRPFELLKRRD